nr:MAG TPA: Muramidase (flagellum-specific) [Caudoviricetes sp.]
MNFPIVASRHDYVNVFFNQLAPIVVNEYIRRKGQKRLFPSTVLAMAALESGYNLNATTLFGIKGNGVVLDTTEYINGEYINIKDSFKCYPSLTASVQGLYDLMQWEHYDKATSCIDYEEECRMVQACGYATDPEYANKLISIINAYQLTMFNNIEEQKETTEEQEELYTVQSGDNLWNIVREYYNLSDDTEITDKVVALAQYNNIEDPSLIYAGQILKMI